MDILYVVGTGSKLDNNELRYSLRSIAKNGKNVGRVFIVGNKPDFVSDEVIHIQCFDWYDKAHKNILYKTEKAISSGKLGNHFLISSDDHFYLREVDFDNYPLYYKKETIEGGTKADYFRSLQETKEFLEQHKLPTCQTNPHCNTHFDVDVWRANRQLFQQGILLKYGVEMNCLMGNLLIKRGQEPQPYRDVKIKNFTSREDLLEQIGDAECISIYDNAIPCGIFGYLYELFTEPCKYEK